MNPGLPVVSSERAARALERAGFVRAGGRGSHVKLRHPDGRIAIVPLHRELALGTLRSILRQSGLSIEEFRQFL